MNSADPLTNTFLLRILEDSINLAFNSAMWYLIAFFTVFFVLAILRYLFRIFR